jgi:hypothetical protein
MPATTQHQPGVVDEKVWRAWQQRGKLRDQATAQKAKMLAGIVALAAIGSAFYLLAVR